MFAVIVLGIGFILVAAIFPVMITQSKATVEETTAAATARGALAFTSKLAENGDTALQGPLLPATDLYFTPATPEAQASVGAATPANAFQIRLPHGAQCVSPGRVLSFNDRRLQDTAGATYRSNLWNGIKGSLILPSDTRYAWVALYRRDQLFYNPPSGNDAVLPSNPQSTIIMKAPYATIYLFPVAVRDRTNFNPDPAGVDLAGPVLSNLEPRPVQFQLVRNAAALSGYVMIFDRPRRSIDNPAGPWPPAAAADTFDGPNYNATIESISEGAFVIVSDDRITGPVQIKRMGDPEVQDTPVNVNRGRMNGRIFRVGTRRNDLDTAYANRPVYEIAPGSEFKTDPGADGILGTADDIDSIGDVNTDRPADAYVIGRAIKADGTYEGLPQDVGAYVTFVRVN